MDKINVSSSFINQYKHFLDDKKPQTTYKIKYVTSYVEKWLFVMVNIPDVKNINFIDCMCNAGIYLDGGKGTSMYVLDLFNRFAISYPDKTFNLILNDISNERLCIIDDIINNYIGVNAPNIKVIKSNKDVNVFLSNEQFFQTVFNCYPYRSANLVFVDPYNFCTVKISVLKKFLSKHYCELIFNVFTSDFVRNQDKEKMRKFCLEEQITCSTKKEMVEYIKNVLRTGYIKYIFSYEFKIQTNTELYQIMYFTPNIRGLEKLKEALWDTFKGKEFHRNEIQTDIEQTSLFTAADEKDMATEARAIEAKEMLLSWLDEKNEVCYIDIETFIIENTILNSGQIINYVLKPLIEEKRIKKLGYSKRANNYKNDKYIKE